MDGAKKKDPFCVFPSLHNASVVRQNHPDAPPYPVDPKCPWAGSDRPFASLIGTLLFLPSRPRRLTQYSTGHMVSHLISLESIRLARPRQAARCNRQHPDSLEEPDVGGLVRSP